MQVSDTPVYAGKPEEIIKRIREGEENLREPFILNNLEQLIYTISAITGRVADKSSEELKIAIKTFNESIGSYDFDDKTSFKTYSNRLVKERILEYIEGKNKSAVSPIQQPVNHAEPPVQAEVPPEKKIPVSEAPVRVSVRNNEVTEISENPNEILSFALKLKNYRISLTEIGKFAPTERETKIMCAEIVEMLMISPQLTEYIHRSKKLPAQQLALQFGTSSQTIRQCSKYIIVLYIIRSSGMNVLKDYIEKFRKSENGMVRIGTVMRTEKGKTYLFTNDITMVAVKSEVEHVPGRQISFMEEFPAKTSGLSGGSSSNVKKIACITASAIVLVGAGIIFAISRFGGGEEIPESKPDETTVSSTTASTSFSYEISLV